MLKKSLKIGSMLLLIFAMAAFVFVSCDSGSSDNEPEDTPAGPVDPDPGKPDPVEPPATVTRVTITPPTEDILAGREYLLQAVVSGTASDKTVGWELALADTDLSHNVEDGTFIVPYRGAGRLKIDGGQVPGTVLTITARSNADPSVSGSLTVTVMRPGPRLSWTPNQIGVRFDPADEGNILEGDDIVPASSTGRLLDIFGKDITVYDGEYLEGQHYSVRRVDNLNQRIEGGTVSVTGDPDLKTITVTLAGPLSGEKGPIGVTLYPGVFEGADAGLIDLEGPGAELVFNATSESLLTGLGNLEDIPTPTTGGEREPDLTGTNLSAVVTWTGLSGSQYTHREKAVATVTITPAAGYTFYVQGITVDTLKNKFKNGAPEVVLVSKAGTKIVARLTYTITAQRINQADLTLLYLDDLLVNDMTTDTTITIGNDSIVKNLVNHNEEAPVVLRTVGESPRYSLSRPVVWKEGLSGKYFFGGKTAVAEVTIPAKPGYTFDRTNITNAYLEGIFANGGPAADIISAGDSLVFTLSYYVKKGEIDGNVIAANVTKKLPVPVVDKTGTAKDVDFTKSGGPFTGTLVWSGLAGNKFVAGQTSTATITLLAADGYEFADSLNVSSEAISIAPASVEPTLNTGSKVELRVTFSSGANYPRKVVSSVGPGSISFVANSLVHNTDVSGGITTGAGVQVAAINGSDSTFAWGIGLSGNNLNYNATIDHNVYATLTLKPVAGFTFAGIPINSGLVDLIKASYLLAGQPPVLTTSSISVSGENLVAELKYPIAKLPLVPGTVVGALADFNVKPAKNENIPTTVIGVGTADVIISDRVSWPASVINSTDSSKFINSAGNVTYTFTLKPKYEHNTFVGTTEATWENTFEDETSYLTISQPDAADVVIDEENDTLTVTLSWTFTS